MHKRNHSYIRTKLPRARNTCVDDSNSQVPLYVTYLNKYAVTKFNKYRFPQYPVETILFSLMAQKQKYNCFEKWDCFLMDRATLRSKMKSGEIVVSQLKLDSCYVVPSGILSFNFLKYLFFGHFLWWYVSSHIPTPLSLF